MALDMAWEVLKSPILPETAKQAHKIKPWFIRDAPREKTYHEKHTVDFQHPHTRKIYPMTAYTYYDKDKNPENIQVHLTSPEGDDVGISDFRAGVDYWTKEGTTGHDEWVGGPIIHAREWDDDIWQEKEYDENKPHDSPVGMGTAMYELAATLGQKHGVQIVPSDARNWQARNMWAKHEEKGYWPPNEDMLRVLNEQ